MLLHGPESISSCLILLRAKLYDVSIFTISRYIIKTIYLEKTKLLTIQNGGVYATNKRQLPLCSVYFNFYHTMHIDTLNDCRVVVNLLITLYDFLHLYPFFFSSSVGHLHESLPYIYLKFFKFMVTILCFYLICCYEFYHQVKILILTWARVLLSIGEARFICFLNLCKAFFS